jgi:hypothetical protein
LGTCLSNLCVALNGQERWDDVIRIVQAAVQARNAASRSDIMWQHLMHAQVMLGRLDDAGHTLRLALPSWRREGALRLMGWLISAWLAGRGALADAVRIQEAAIHWHELVGRRLNPVQQLASDRVAAALERAGVAPADVERWRREGCVLDEAQVEAICEAMDHGC